MKKERKEQIKEQLSFEDMTLSSKIVVAVKNGRVSEAITKIATAELWKAGYPVTFEDSLVLFLLFYYSGISQRQIAEVLDRDSPSVTRLIDQLEVNGFLERRNDPKDRRAKKIYLTEKGEEITPKITEIAINAFKKSFEGITKEEIDIMQSVLQRLIDNLDKYNKEISDL